MGIKGTVLGKGLPQLLRANQLQPLIPGVTRPTPKQGPLVWHRWQNWALQRRQLACLWLSRVGAHFLLWTRRVSQRGTQTPGSFGWGHRGCWKAMVRIKCRSSELPLHPFAPLCSPLLFFSRSGKVQNPPGFKVSLSVVDTWQCGLLLPCPGQQNLKWVSEKHAMTSPSS